MSTFVRIVNEKRGYLSKDEIEVFLNAGYTKEHILGVITAIGLKTTSNYSNHIFEIPLDDAFKNKDWKKQ